MRIRAIAASLLLARAAAAEPWAATIEAERTSGTYISLPLLLGATNLNSGGGVLGARPEVVFATHGPSREDPIRRQRYPGRGWGAGGYGEVLDLSGDLVLGAGATLAAYDMPYSLALSVGAYRRWTEEPGGERGLTASLFGGYRPADFGMPIDLPAGLRVEGRLGLDGPRELAVTVSANIDLTLVVAAIGLTAYGVATH